MTRHRFDPFSFIAGAVAVGVAVAVLLGQVSISLVDLRIGGPVLVLALGLALLLGGGRDRVDAGAGDDAAAGDEAAGGDAAVGGEAAAGVGDTTATVDADEPRGP